MQQQGCSPTRGGGGAETAPTLARHPEMTYDTWCSQWLSGGDKVRCWKALNRFPRTPTGLAQSQPMMATVTWGSQFSLLPTSIVLTSTEVPIQESPPEQPIAARVRCLALCGITVLTGHNGAHTEVVPVHRANLPLTVEHC